MGREDVRAALERMDDDEVRERIEAGDLADLGDLSLDDAEQELVRGAAADYPEVVGFAFTSFGLDVTQKVNTGFAMDKWKLNPGYNGALKYALQDGVFKF